MTKIKLFFTSIWYALPDALRGHIVSFIQTFVAVFGTTLFAILATIPTETLLKPETWNTSFVVAILLSAVRSAVKIAWEATFGKKGITKEETPST